MTDIDGAVVQTFGGKNLLRVGVILQRGIIILLMFCLPCWGLLINAQAILLCMGQEPEAARYQIHSTASATTISVSLLLTNTASGFISCDSLYRVSIKRGPLFQTSVI